MAKEATNKEKLMTELEAVIFSLRPHEEIRIKKDEFGKPGRIVVLSSCTTILDFED